MSLSHDDPRLTAYVLGELCGEEREAFEQLLVRDARACAEVEAIAALSARLGQELRSGSPALSERRRASLRALRAPNGAAAPETKDTAQPEIQSDEQIVPSLRPRRRSWVLLAAIVPALGLAALVFTRAQQSEDSALVVEVGIADPIASSLGGKSQEYGVQQKDTPTAPSLVAQPQQEVQPWGDSKEQGQGIALRGEGIALRGEGIALRGEGIALRASLENSAALMEAPTSAPREISANRMRAASRAVPRADTVRRRVVAAEGIRAGDGAGTDYSRESYDSFEENPFVNVTTDPRSTFSIDVDTAAYALVRRFLQGGQLPPHGAVRIEELINYFTYRYPQPSGDAPVSIAAAVAPAPWAPQHQLVRVALQARHVAASARPPANLVFLIDVSGSMEAPNKLGLVKYGLRQLSESLGERDRVSIVTYAGNSGLVLAPTPGNRRSEILQAIDQLEAGGSTNGGAGIELAYSLARKHFVTGNVNRVLLATDGDFNVGVTSQSELVELVQKQAKSGVFLSVLGFGDGNYQDSMLEKLADKGNGNYAYIDEPAEAQKVLVEQATGTLVTLAKDVKLQLEFNPAQVAAYRLIGYENRKLAHQDFNDDTKDAGEIGADHSVTALYEVIPLGQAVPGGVDPLKYQAPAAAPAQPPTAVRDELLNIKLRYQPPLGGASQLIERAVRGPAQTLDADFRFAAAVAEFGMLLRDSAHRGKASYDQVLKLAQASLGDGKDRREREQFVELVRSARRLAASGSQRIRDPLNTDFE